MSAMLQVLHPECRHPAQTHINLAEEDVGLGQPCWRPPAYPFQQQSMLHVPRK